MQSICTALMLNLLVILPSYNSKAYGGESYFEDFEQRRSQHNFKRNNYLIKTTPNWTGIKTLKVCKKNQCLLTSKSSEERLLWLGFACLAIKQSNKSHLLDGEFPDEIFQPGRDPLIDLNADGIPDLIVIELDDKRGNRYTVYSLGKKFHKLAEIREQSLFMRFVDIDGDGRYEALSRDMTFLRWNAPPGGSATPTVILNFGKRGFEVATQQMRSMSPSKKEQEQMLLSWRETIKAGKKKENLDPQVWADMLRMIYTGNAKTAYGMLDRFWPDGKSARDLGSSHSPTTKDEFKELFLKQLKQSRYFADIRKINPGFTFEMNPS